jgi:hypothetical protein
LRSTADIDVLLPYQNRIKTNQLGEYKMTPEQVRALQQIAKGIIESCQTFAPGGVIYAALMSKGCSLNQYQQIMGQLVQAGMLTQDGECYTATEKGNKFITM